MDPAPRPTHAVSTPNKPPTSTLDLVRFNLNEKYLTQVTNFFDGDKRAAMRFMTGFIDYIRRVPKLMECTPISLINTAMMFASFRFMPSSVAGEAYMIPYNNNREGTVEAQFQPGYQGYVTLFYRAGVRAIQGEIVREHDEFSLENGMVSHKVDPRKGKKERGAAIGAYVRVVLPSGEPVHKYMNASDIIDHAKRFSKAFSKNDSPWKEENDPELHMWKKTVLLQMKSMLPKNSELLRAMEEDFKDSTVSTASMLDAAALAAQKTSHAPQTKDTATDAEFTETPATPVATEKPDTGELCPKKKHDRKFMSEDGADCLACMEEDLAQTETNAPDKIETIEA